MTGPAGPGDSLRQMQVTYAARRGLPALLGAFVVIMLSLSAALAQTAKTPPPLKPESAARAQLLRQEIAELEKKVADGAVELVDKRLQLISILEFGEHYAEARQLIDETLPAAQRLHAGSSRHFQLLYWSAVVEYDEQRFRQSLQIWAKALPLARALDAGDGADRTGRVLERQAYCHRMLDEHAQALAIATELMQGSVRKHGVDSLQVGRAHEELSRSYLALSRLELALQHAVSMLEIYGRKLDPAGQKLVDQLSKTAGMLSSAGKPAEAETLLLRAQQRCMNTYAAQPSRCTGLALALSEHYGRNGREQEALAQADQARRASRGQAADEPEAKILSALGVAQARMQSQDFSAAERALQEALQLQASTQAATEQIALALVAFADVADRQGRIAAAELALRRASELFARTAADDVAYRLLIGTVRGATLLRQSRAAEAEALYRSLLAPARQLDGSQRYFIVVIAGELARALAMRGRFAEVDTYMAEGLYAILTWPQFRQLVADYLHAALIVYSVDRPELAIYLGKLAVNTYQAIRSDMDTANPIVLGGYTQSVAMKYRDLANLLLDRGRLPEAEQVLAMLKEEELFDFLRRDSRVDPRQARISFTATEARWARRQDERVAALDALDEKQRQLGAIPESQRSAQQRRELARVSRETARAQQALGDYVREMIVALGKAPAPAAGLGDDPAMRAAIERSRRQLRELPAGTVLVHYLLIGDRLRILLSTRGGWLQRDSRISASALAQDIARFRRNLRDPAQDPRPVAQRLYQLLIAPIEADLRGAEARTLMFSLDGILRYIPMAALHDGRQWLAERYASTLFTAAARERLTQLPQSRWRAAGFGVREGGSVDGWNFDPLPAVERELSAVVRSADDAPSALGVLPGIRRLDGEFTRESLAAAIQQGYPVVHVASHFHFDAAAAAQSFLLLGGGRKLGLDELGRDAAYDLSQVDLITLSACETALESPGADGREVEGLGTLAQRRGARSVLATLWPVADGSSADFMHALYSLQQRPGATKAQALQLAQQQFIAATAGGTAAASAARTADGTPAWSGVLLAHPYFWSGYILMGNWL